MNTNFIITFLVGVGLYIIVVLIVGFIKRIRNKRKIKQEDKEKGVIQDEKSEIEDNGQDTH